ncbi:MAG TPA: hypothetical protein VLC09_02855 [Polyangiaceae bacterium]|nr:hypothetical protein [Polyangiaceae bacterium]
MKRTKQNMLGGIAILLALAATACGGGDPTKDETCGKCSATFKDACELGYDACADTSNCSLSDYKEQMESVCP